MKKLFLIRTGYIISKSDRQEHFIDASKLMSIYGVPHYLCEVADIRYPERSIGKSYEGLIELTPCFDHERYEEIKKYVVEPALAEYFANNL